MTCRPLKLLISPCFTGKSRAETTAFDHLSTGLRKDYEVQCRATSGSYTFLFGWITRFAGQSGSQSTNELQSAFESTRHTQSNQCRNLVQRCGFVWRMRKSFTAMVAKDATAFTDFVSFAALASFAVKDPFCSALCSKFFPPTYVSRAHTFSHP